MTTLDRFIKVHNRLNLLADEGAVGLLSKADVATIAYALGIASGWVVGRDADRLTPAERKALAALHRWLHSPVGDCALTDEAADYHEQVEAEQGTAECERLEAEEGAAYAAFIREQAIELARRTKA